MKIVVVQAHPNFKDSVLNKKFSQRLDNITNVEKRDLYALYPDWKIDIEKEQKALLEADRIVFQFPFYWYNVPPMLKKYLDDVFSYGFAYGVGGDKLKGKEFVVATTAGGPSEAYRAGGFNNYQIDELLRPLQQTANLTQMIYRPAFIVNDAVRLGQANDSSLLDSLANQFVEHITGELDPAAKLRKINESIEDNGGM